VWLPVQLTEADELHFPSGELEELSADPFAALSDEDSDPLAWGLSLD
jgi:hypothetical protein